MKMVQWMKLWASAINKHAIEGVQFHPESILTQHGHDLLNNFLES